MVDIADKVLGVTGGVSCLVSYIFYKLYRSRTETARQVKNIPIWEPGEDLFTRLSQEGVLTYAAVEGVVKELGRTLQSNHGGQQGVIKQSQLTEHKSQRNNGFWSDVKKTLRDTTEYVPFALVSNTSKGGSKFKVEVVEAGHAASIKDELDTTFDHFEPNRSSLMQIGIDRLMGDLTKGLQETERMLLTGTSILSIGKVVLERGQMKMTPPDDDAPGRTYILTKMHLSQLVRHYESQSSTYRLISLLAAVIGGGIFAFIAWRHIRGLLEKYRQRRQFEEIRRSVRAAAERRREARRRREDNAGTTTEDDVAANGDHAREGFGGEDNSCVVCLSNPRQVVTLDCGHISMCADCAEALPVPKKCPVCRANVVRFLPVYHP